MAGDWTDAENDAIVADYFAMLAADLAGQAYSKAEHNRRLQARIGRARGSIEYKHQNISAVLKGLGETWLLGYTPAFNLQASLIDAVIRWLDEPAHRSAPPSRPAQVDDDQALWIRPPPTHSNLPPPAELGQMTAIARKYDAAGRDARNRALGEAGEQRVLWHERSTLHAAKRSDLAKRVVWVSRDEGDGAGFDIRSFAPDGSDRLIEVKTTNGWERTPFYITRNELAFADTHGESWRLVRLWQFSREPQAFELRTPLTAHVSLMASVYQADLL